MRCYYRAIQGVEFAFAMCRVKNAIIRLLELKLITILKKATNIIQQKI